MPIYEYQCNQCDKRFEALRPMSQMDTTIACPACGAPNARRKISVFSAISREAGGSRIVAGPTAASGCGGCSSGNCSSCRH